MYNDNPILSDEEYLLISGKYNNRDKYERTETLNKMLLAINQSKQFCYSQPSFNKQLNLALQQVKQAIETVSENLSTAFFVEQTRVVEIKQINVFAFTKKLAEIIGLSFEVYLNEEKEYIKRTISANIKLLNSALECVLSALANSNISLFRFM